MSDPVENSRGNWESKWLPARLSALSTWSCSLPLSSWGACGPIDGGVGFTINHITAVYPAQFVPMIAFYFFTCMMA